MNADYRHRSTSSGTYSEALLDPVWHKALFAWTEMVFGKAGIKRAGADTCLDFVWHMQ